SRKALSPNLPFFGIVASTVAVFCAFGLIAYRSNGLPARLSPSARDILAEADDFDPDRQICALYGPPVPQDGMCRLGTAPQDPPRLALWGDSHAEAWRPAFDDMAARHMETGIYVGRVACAPIIEVERLDEPECVAGNEKILRFILTTPSIH